MTKAILRKMRNVSDGLAPPELLSCLPERECGHQVVGPRGASDRRSMARRQSFTGPAMSQGRTLKEGQYVWVKDTAIAGTDVYTKVLRIVECNPYPYPLTLTLSLTFAPRGTFSASTATR